MFFAGPTIYSYGSHFPMASFHDAPNGEQLILLTTRGYSVTTAKHLSYVRQAIGNNDRVLYCHNVVPKNEAEHRENLDSMLRTFVGIMNKAARARSNFEYLCDQMQNLVERHYRYRKAFLIECDALRIPEDWKAQATIRLAEQAKLDKARRAKREKEAQVRAQQAIENMHAWAAGVEMPHKHIMCREFPAIQLRLKNEETVETSKGAEIPVSHAHRLWGVVSQIKIGARPPYMQNGHTLHAGTFEVRSIAANGTLVAGCHTMTYEAMLDFAARMQWASK